MTKAEQTSQEQRKQAIIYIAKSSASYECGNIDFRETHDGIEIFDNNHAKHDVLHGVSMVTHYQGFNSYVYISNGFLYLRVY
jgi:hypothetical protein